MHFVKNSKHIILLLAFFLPLCGSSKLVKLDTKDLEIDYFDVRVEEVSREDSVSVIQITRSSGMSGDEALFVIRAFCLIAREREMRYFVIIEEGEDKKGIYTYRVGYLHEQIENLKGHFGVTIDRPLTDKEVMDSMDLMSMFGW